MTSVEIPDAEFLRVLRMIARDYVSGKLSIGTPQRDFTTPYIPTPIYVHNDSGVEIPAWACMQVTGTEEQSGQNYLLVDQPADSDGSSGWYLFNGPYAIAANANGVAQYGAVVRGYKNTGTITAGDRWQPVASQWYIEQDANGIFVAVGADDIGTNVLKVMQRGGGGVSFWRFTLNEAWTAGVADADILEMDGTDTTIDADVNDPLGIFADLTTNDAGICFLQNGVYYVIQAPCPA